MTTHYLVFPDQATAITAMPELWQEGAWASYLPTGQAIDVIGTHYRQTGVMLAGADGLQYPETVAVPGFHINLSYAPPVALQPFEVFPVTPSRMFS